MKALVGLGAAVAVVGAALILFALSGDSDDTAPPSAANETVDQFDTVEDASKAAGFPILRPAIPDWEPMGTVIVRRTGAHVTVNAAFEHADRSIALTIEQPEAQEQPMAAVAQPVAVRGTNGLLQQGTSGNADLVILTWNEDGLTYLASTLLETWTVDDFLATIESLA